MVSGRATRAAHVTPSMMQKSDMLFRLLFDRAPLPRFVNCGVAEGTSGLPGIGRQPVIVRHESQPPRAANGVVNKALNTLIMLFKCVDR